MSTTSQRGPDWVQWDGTEYYDVEHARGWCMLSAALYWATGRTHFPCMSSGPDRQYRLHFQDGSSSDRTKSGDLLQKKGLSIALTVPDSSEQVFIDEVR